MYPYFDLLLAKAIVEERLAQAEAHRLYREVLAQKRQGRRAGAEQESPLARAFRSLREFLARRPAL